MSDFYDNAQKHELELMVETIDECLELLKSKTNAVYWIEIMRDNMQAAINKCN